jgi:hypothetical protein
MLNESFVRQREEVTNLRRRNEDLLSHASRVEAASHQVSEQLATANSAITRLRHETATLQAEKELWKVGFVSRLRGYLPSVISRELNVDCRMKTTSFSKRSHS